MIHVVRTRATPQEMTEQILDPNIRERVAEITRRLMGGI